MYVILIHCFNKRTCCERTKKGHIPGAIELDTLALESHETWNRRSPEELKKTFEEKGITSKIKVIKKYKEKKYKDLFCKAEKTRENLMGLPPKKRVKK